MSYYLCFKKNGTPICSYCRVHPLYETLHEFAPWEKWEVLSRKDLEDGKELAQLRLQQTCDELDKLEKLLEGIQVFDGRSDIIETMGDLEDKFSNLQKTIVMIDMLIDIFDEGDPEQDNYKPTPMEWGIF